MTKDKAIELINIYQKAWVEQNSDLILTIFTPDAVYDDPHESVNHGHEEIKKYWEMKVVNGQKDINFKLLHLWIDNDSVLAEWEADFIDVTRNLKIEMNEIAIFTISGDKFSSLREYYKTKKIPL